MHEGGGGVWQGIQLQSSNMESRSLGLNFFSSPPIVPLLASHLVRLRQSKIAFRFFLKKWSNKVEVSTEVVPGGAVQLPGLLLQLLHVPPQHVQPDHHCMGSEIKIHKNNK